MHSPGTDVSTIPHRPTRLELAVAQTLLAPWDLLTSPAYFGLEHVPRDRPVLFAGNHTLGGVLDIPIMAMGLYRATGIYVRFLGDHAHFNVPVWRDVLARLGTVDGTPEICRALMRAGESILVFPGGSREVFKRRGEAYRLIWKQRVGFARLAIEHGYPIVPFAAVGAEECFDILVDGDEMRGTPLRHVVELLSPRADVTPPLVRGVGLTMLPRPQRFYFKFAPPIETADLGGRASDAGLCFAVREEVRRAVEAGIGELQRIRARDAHRFLVPRLWARLLGRLNGAP